MQTREATDIEYAAMPDLHKCWYDSWKEIPVGILHGARKADGTRWTLMPCIYLKRDGMTVGTPNNSVQWADCIVRLMPKRPQEGPCTSTLPN